MTIEFPTLPNSGRLMAEELRLELACALYSRGPIGKVEGSKMAGTEIFTFQKSLGGRQISAYPEEMLKRDLKKLKEEVAYQVCQLRDRNE